ncbi:putative protein kinase RLK-Pelle-CrRLK1L-1 family [Helianthus annuus]|nr:putative protein kinase RLK-Pelle-CrRLK1L-1 family [Helianthus annuus]
MQMKVSVTSTMFTNITCKLSNGVCEFWTECSQETLYLSVSFCLCIYINSTHCMGIYTQPKMSSPKDPIDGPKDHLSMTSQSKDQHGPRKITFRGQIIRSISFDEIEGSTSSFDLLSFETETSFNLYQLLSKSNRRMVDLGKNFEHLKIRLDDIKLATDNFSDTYKNGSSGYCTWYKVDLDHFDKEKLSSVEGESSSELPKRHNKVNIKRFFPKDDEHEEELFFTELEVLTSVKHDNIGTLIGFCVEGFELILVTEKFSNGLKNYLGNVRTMHTLTWEQRLKICIDLAHALSYLHSEMEERNMIIHSNINHAKFGWDENLVAKIEDFEFAVFLPPNQNDEVLCKRTNFESKYYVDPEYEKTGKLKRESNVYSFGVVLFEILCGRHAFNQSYLNESEKGLVHVARQNFCNGTIEEMIDPILKEKTSIKSYNPNRGANKDSLHTFMKVANQCVAETQDHRPTMKVVLNELKKALIFQVCQVCLCVYY